jgi:pilus assembly protein CpaC
MRQVALITVNGSSATFRSGGEVNIPVTQGLTAGVQKVNFGSRVQVQPRFDKETNRIQLRINANVSNLTEPGAGGNVPGRNVSNLNTVVNLKMGQSVVLAGLISESSRTSQSGLPGLSQIPILGVLFGSNQKQAESTQNLLFIVPTVVDVVSMNARERISDAFSVYWDYSGGIEDIKMLSTPEDIPSAARPEAKPLDELAEEANDEGDGDDDGGGGDDDGN